MRLVLLVVAAGTLACNHAAAPGEGDGGLLRVQPEALLYPAGATASLTLTNLAPFSLQYSPCFSRLERQTPAGAWIVVYQDERPCPAVLQFLEPWASRQLAVPLPATLAPAAHRLRFPSIGVPKDGDFATATQFGDSFLVQP